MNKPNNHINTYTAQDIQKYLGGELSASEMHQLEKAALEDPFLADAIEGYNDHPTPINEDLGELQTRLEKAIAKDLRKSRFPIWTRVAAALILLIGLSLIVRNGLQKNSTTSDIALQKPAPAASPAASADSTSASAAAEAPAPAVADSSSIAIAHPIRKQKEKIHISPQSLAATQPAQDTVLSKSTDPTLASNEVNFSTSRAFRADTTRLIGTQTWANLKSSASVVSGVVVDQHNKPLSGATLSFKGNDNVYATTNQQGYFNMALPKRDSISRINVSLVGYKPATLDIRTLDEDASIIHLEQQSTALDEVVVAGYGKYRKETRALAPSDDFDQRPDTLWLKASPVIGKQAYIDYLNNGKAAIHADSSIKGDVLISFNVDRQGALTDFKIEKSLSPTHDSGVIRLISEGPHWRLLRGRHARPLVKVSF